MITAELSRIKRFGKRAFRVALCSMLVMQALWVPNSSLAAMSAFVFRGYDVENISAGSLSYASSGASVSGRSITISPLAGEGEVIGLVNLNETGGDITKSVDLGGLEIDFSAVSSIIEEGENGADNDAPTVKILFCSSGDIGSAISSVTLKKQDPAVAGSETLSSGAKIPGGTRSIFLSFQGASKTGTNTVSFSNISLVIHDSGAPSCSADYLQNWTNQDVTVTITAADSDAGLEGIYINDVRMSETSPYVFTVSTNNTSFSAYALDLAGKKSEVVSGTIDHIDKTTPSAPSSVPLSNSAWTNGDVFVQMPTLSAGTGSPERYVYQIGAGAWTDLPAGFAISAEGNTVIRVAVADAAGNRSASAQAAAKIDKSAPIISDAVITPGSLTAKVDVSASEVGLSGMQKFCYAAGNQTADYFTTGGTPITGSTFNVSSGGTYTIYAADNAGNETLKTIAITTAPKFDTIGNVVTDEDEMCSIALPVYDAESSISRLIFRITVSDNDLLDPVTLHQTDDGASLDITPAANRSGGPVNVTVVVEDESGLTATRSFTVTVEPVNDDPIAQDDLDIAVPEDGGIEIDVLANDGDAADGDTVSISNVGKAANGTTMNVLGKIRYTPNENFAGTDTFTYDITDGKGGTAQAKVTLIVNQVNDAPTAINDKAYTAEDTALTIDALNNDSDPDMPTNEQETIVLASCVNGAHGTAQIVEGKIVYTPNADFNGTDTFGYTIADKAGITAEATVTVVVSPETDAPRFAGLSDEFTIDEDAMNHEIAFEIYDVETPADSVMLQAATLNEEMIDPSGVVISGLGDHDPAVKLLLTPAANMHGDVSLKLTLGDGFDSVERTILIHINNVNDAPRAGSDTKTFTEDAAYLDISIASLLLNDSDIDGDPIFFDGLASDPSVGEITLLDEATLRYTPAHDFDGTTSFTYYVSDGTARTLATCTLTANGVNDAPGIVVAETELNGTEDTWIVIPFRISDNESDHKDLKVIAASSDARVITTDGIQIINNNDGTGEVRILPAADAFGSPVLTLTVSDGEAHASDTVKLIIAPAQDAPIAEADLIYAHYTARLTFGVLANDHDVDGGEIEISGFTEDLPGSLTLDEATQTFTYVPAVGENGIKTFRYTITDGTAESSATVTLSVMSETNAPVITAIDSRYVGEDETVSGIAFSVSDEDAGDTAAIRVDSDDTMLLPEDAAHITVNDLENGSFTLTLKPGADQTGSTRVTVTVTDDAGLTDSTSFYLHVIAQNDAPVAADDTLSVDEDGAVALTLLANDTDADKDTIWLSNLATPAHGYIKRVGNDYTYYPYADWSGTESLTYRISDGRAYAQASVSITVNPVNDAPVARDDWKSVPNDLGTESATIDVLHNDYDTDSGDVIHTLDIVTPPLYGTAEVQPDGTILYTRTQISPLGNGADSFRYRMIDRANTEEPGYESATATVHIGEVFTGSLNTYDKHVTCYEDDKPFTIELSVDNPTPVNYALTVNTATALGTFEVLDNNTVRFTPAADQYGYAAITYTVEQIEGTQKDTGTIWLRVYPVNDLPEITAVPDSITFTEDASEGNAFDVEFRDADCANDDLYFYAYTKSGQTTAPIPFMVFYSVTRTGAGSRVTIRTAENANGFGVIVVGVSDGMTYDEAEIDLNVTPVDDAPKTNDITRTMKEDSCITFASPGSDCDVDGDTIVETIDPMRQPQNGQATIGANRTIRYVPNANFSGEETFYVIVTDQTETGLSAAAKVTIEVTPVNDAPEIHDLAYYQTTQEDSAIDVHLRASDIDNDLTESTSYTLTSEDDTLVTNGNISISHVDGDEMVIHVVPETNAYGTVKINVAASDGNLSANGAFLLKIVPVNDPPEAEDDADSVNEAVSVAGETKAPQTVATIDLLHNDPDVEDGSPSIVAISDIVNEATVTNIGGGEVLVAADGDFSGKVTFRYTVMDRAGATDSADVTLTILPMNDPPTAKPDSFTINEDATPLFSVLGNDSDPEGNTLSIFEVSDPAHGSATIDGTKISYVPTANYNGKDSFTYTVSDGNGGTATATVSITIKPVNDAPTVSKHSSNLGKWTTLEDTTKAFHFVVADAESPVNNLIIKITSLDETLVKTTQIALSTSEAGYKTITVTPNENVHGELDLKIWVSDGSLTGEGVYPLEIIGVNDAPVVTAPGVKTKEDTSVHAIATAVDPDGDEVAFDAWTTPKNGTVVVNADGSFDYTPDMDFNGVDSFLIRAVDLTLDQKEGYATVSITVEPDGDPPVAGDDEIDIDEDSPIAITVLDNDSDEDALYGDVISILRVTKPAHGTAVIDGDTILYTPAKDYNGTDSFVYTITDKDGKTDTATVSAVIQPVNDAPSGGNDTASVAEDHSVTIDVTRNDDVDETTNPEMEDVVIVSVDTPAHGTATPSSDNKSILYTPNADWFSPENEPEVFYYTAKDSSDKTERFSVSVTVTPVNDLPVITPDNLEDVTTAEDTRTRAITFTVSDVETAAGSLTVTATHRNGVLLPAISVTPDANGACSFTVLPYENKVGSAAITVKVTDADGGEDRDELLLTVTPVNDAPKAGDDAFTVAENATCTADVLANDDVDTQPNNGGDTLTLLSNTNPQYGTATIVDNKIYYVPKSDRDTSVDYYDTFTYTMQDEDGIVCTPTVTMKVTPVNDPPKISAIASVTGVLEDAPNGTGDIGFSVTDEEDNDDTLSVSIACNNTALFPLSNITITNPTDDATGSLRTVKAIPAANKFGTAKITLTVKDSKNATTSTWFNVTVVSVDDVPNNGNKSFTVVEDVEKQLDLLKDIDPDYATTPGDFTITKIDREPSHGTVRIATDQKTVYYKTVKDSNAADSFDYTIYDLYGKAYYTFTASITVTPVNDAPVITYLGSAEYTIAEGTQKNDIPFTVEDVDNVAFAGGASPVEVNVTAKSSNSILLVNGIHIDTLEGYNRDIDLKPYLKWNGSTTVTITATDPDGESSSASFVLNVSNVNDVPVAVNDTGTIPEDEATAFDVLENDTDGDLITNTDAEKLKVNSVTDEDENATITKSDDALSVIVTPNENYNGPVQFTYTVLDASGAISETAVVRLTISQVNDAPLTEPDAAETQEDTAVKIYVLENDDDVDLDPEMNAHPGDESIGVRITGTELKAPSHGTIATDGEAITYTPSANYNGIDTFDYYCSDETANTIARVTVTIRQVNDNPAAKDDGTTADEDKPMRYDVLANDTDADTVKELNEDELHSRNDFVIESYSFVGEAHGTVEIDGASIVFTPEADFSGTQAVRYVLSDGKGGTSTATLTILVGSEEDAPVATADFLRAEEDHTASVNVLENDTDVDTGDTKTFDGFVGTIEGLPGTFATDENGDVSFTPNANYNGTFEVIYQVVDSAGLTDTAMLRVTITPVNDAPAANDASAEADEDTAKEIDVSTLIDDADILTNEDVITVSIQEAGEPAHGTSQVNGTKITYTPDANFNGADEIVYTVTDADGASDTGTLDITVRPVNDAPEAGDDEATLGEDTVKEIAVLVNDGDIDTLAALNLSPAEQPSIRSVTDGAHGKATTDGSKIIYTPDENYNGADTITYVLTDGALEDSASVAITIEQRNDAIHAEDDSAKTNDEDTVTLDVLHNDWDVDTDETLNEDELHLRASFRITAVGTPENGKAEIAAGKIDYTPNDRFSGTDSFTYTITDGKDTTASAKVTISVISVNDPPVILAVSSPKDGDRAGTGSKVAVEWSGFDIDGDVLTYRLEYYDGKAWQLLDNNLTDTKYVFAIPDSLASTDGLKFRVNARDAEFTSEYGYSGAMQVDKDAPKGTVVTMKTADGRAYTAGTWTNRTVTVVAASALDASRVTYYYDMDGGASAAAAGMDVVAGVHTVNINAADEYNNTAVVGAYLARVDKQQPAVPEIRESISGGSVLLTLTLQADPGGSGNDKLALPDGTSVKASGRPTFTVVKNGVYSFTLTDIAGNRRVFTHTVNSADVSKPIITLSSGAYRVGTATQDAITAALTFLDSESDLVSRGYQLSTGGTPGGSYRTYDDVLRMSDPGTYYVHAYAKNAFGLTAYETFGPFIVEAAQAPDASPTPEQQSGDVVVTKDDVEEIPGDTVKIRLPGKEWNETLTLEDVGPGTNLIEAMDEGGNVRSVEVRVSMRDIFARSLRSAGDQVTAAAIVVITALAAIAIALLLAGYNVTVVVVGSHGVAQQKLRTLRRIKFRRKELVIKLEDKHLMDGEFCDLKIAKPLSKQMRKNIVIVTMRGAEVLREQIPEDFDEAFRRKIRIER